MQIAHTPTAEPVSAGPGAPAKAICPHCQGEVTLRRRRRMNNGGYTYFWRHRANQGPPCQARTSPGWRRS